jgi:hypothetical protein
MISTKRQINTFVQNKIKEEITIREMNMLAQEVYPFFRHVIEEENRQFKRYLLSEGYVELYEDLIFEEKLINEGILDTVADVGITAGQMLGGTVGQAAGLAGLAKYTPEFIQNQDKSFGEWFGPFISIFFSLQALLFPFPAVASLKTILKGFANGVGSILRGTGGLAAAGVRALIKKGPGFVGSAAGTISTAIKGVLEAFAKGGQMIKTIAAKIGGEGLLKTLMGGIKRAGEEVVKRLNSLKEALKGAKNLTDEGVEGIVKRVFGAGDEATAITGKLTGFSTKLANSTVANAAFKASQAGREAFSQWVRKHMAKNVDEFAKALKPLEGKFYEGLGTFVGLSSGGAFKFKFGTTSQYFLSAFFDARMFGNFIRKMAELRAPAIDILLASMHIIMPGIKKVLGRAATEITRMSAAAAGGGIDEKFMEDYLTSAPKGGKVSGSETSDVSSSGPWAKLDPRLKSGWEELAAAGKVNDAEYDTWLDFYNQVRKDPETMKALGKKPGEHLRPSEVIKIYDFVMRRSENLKERKMLRRQKAIHNREIHSLDQFIMENQIKSKIIRSKKIINLIN